MASETSGSGTTEPAANDTSASGPAGANGAAPSGGAAGPSGSSGAPSSGAAGSSSGPGSGADSLFDLAERAVRRVGTMIDEAVDKAGPKARSAADATKKMVVDLDGGLDDAFGKISAQARDLMAKGQHTRVRIKFRDRQLAELPIAVVAAAEAASLWWFGPLRLLLGHVVGKSVLDVEFVSNADAHVAEGRAQMADGELDKALAAFDKALAMDRKCAGAWLGKGVALKIRGDKPAAREAFAEAERCDLHGESGREARRHLDNLGAK